MATYDIKKEIALAHEAFATKRESTLDTLTQEAMSPDAWSGESPLKSLKTLVGSKDDGVGAEAGIMAAAASIDAEATAEAFKNATPGKVIQNFAGNTLKMEDITIESFSSANPQEIMAYNFAFQVGATKQEPVVEGFFPMVVQPVGTRTVKTTIDVDYLINEYDRNDGVPGRDKDGAVPYVKTIDSETLDENVNKLVPQSDRKTDWDKFYVKALEHDTKCPVTRKEIKTAPYKVGVTIPVLDIAQTSIEAAGGVFDNKTTLSPNPAVLELDIAVDGEYYSLDTSNSSSLNFTESAIGDGNDIVLVGDTTIEIKPRDLVQAISGDAQTKFTKIPTGFTVKYRVLVQGAGNIESGHMSVHANIWDVIEIKDASGTVVPTTDPAYVDYLADAQLINADGIVGFVPETFIVNDDLARNGTLLSIREKSQNYTLEPSTPLTVQSPVTPVAGKLSDAKYIPTLTRRAMVNNNKLGIKTLLGFVSYLSNNNLDGASEIETMGISRYVLSPWFKSVTLDLRTAVDSVKGAERKGDILATIENQVKVMVDAMMTESNYLNATDGTRDSIDIVIGIHSSLAGFVGTTFDIGADYNVKIVSTRKPQFKDKMIIAPTNWGTERNKEIDVFSFGANLYTPIILQEAGVTKNREISAHLLNKHAIFCPIVGQIIITNLNESLKKIAQWEVTK